MTSFSPSDYKVIIGLEVHAQLLTVSKLFCGCSTTFGAPPNTQTCPICTGMPGVLPVLNKRAVEFALKMGVATNCSITAYNRFARKNYFYPDLPKGYQISQYEEPVCQRGHLQITIGSEQKVINLTRIHLEEDAGKSIHSADLSLSQDTKLDYNRCGVPLIEIVSEPDLTSSQEAYLYLSKLKQILTYLEICDGNMEEGSLRCDANVNIHYQYKGTWEKTAISEIKNLNSFRNVEKAIDEGVKRQLRMLAEGEKIIKETLLWDAEKNALSSMRTKEEAHDYRYFPEPDLVQLNIDPEWIDRVKQDIPELPDIKTERFIKEHRVPQKNAEFMSSSREMGNYFEACVKICKNPLRVSNWIMGEIMKILNEKNITIKNFQLSPQQTGNLLELIEKEIISGKIAKTVFDEMLRTGKEAETIVKQNGLVQITDTSAIELEIDAVLAENPKEVKQYKEGKTKLFGFFIGQIMQRTAGKANPQIVNQILKKKLNL